MRIAWQTNLPVAGNIDRPTVPTCRHRCMTWSVLSHLLACATCCADPSPVMGALTQRAHTAWHKSNALLCTSHVYVNVEPMNTCFGVTRATPQVTRTSSATNWSRCATRSTAHTQHRPGADAPADRLCVPSQQPGHNALVPAQTRRVCARNNGWPGCWPVRQSPTAGASLPGSLDLKRQDTCTFRVLRKEFASNFPPFR